MATKGILVISHASACVGMVSTCEMIMGELEEVESLELHEGENPDKYRRAVERYVDQWDGSCVILVDIMGGTPFNSVMRIAHEREISALTGVNVPMLIEAVSIRDELNPNELVDHLETVAKDGIVTIASILSRLGASSDDEGEDD